MKNRLFLLLGWIAVLGVAQAQAGGQDSVTAAGLFIEGCSCQGICMGAINGSDRGCESLTAMRLNGGRYQGIDMEGVNIVVASLKDKRQRVYLDVSNPRQRAAAKAFATAYASEFGKVDAVKDAHVEIVGRDGVFSVVVDGGKIVELTTAPVFGKDKRSPVAFSNVFDPLNSTFYHAKIVSAKYSDGDVSFTLKDSNAFFNPRMHTSYGSKP